LLSINNYTGGTVKQQVRYHPLCDRRNNATSGYLNEDGENADAVVGLDGVVEAREPRRVPVNQMQLYKTQHTSAQDTHQTTLYGHRNLLCTSKVM